VSRGDYLYSEFLKRLGFEPTPCQDKLLRETADFITCDDADILVVNGYAGTGKTTAMGSVIGALRALGTHCVLLAPTGRAAKVFSGIAGSPAWTIHKHIYRQKGVGDDGFGRFSLAPNESRDTLFIVDEVSLIGLDEGQKVMQFGSGNLLEDLVQFVRNGTGCRLILVGDGAQLPPVGLDASPALDMEYMAYFGGVRRTELVTVVRQARGSGILVNATALRERIVAGGPCDIRLSLAGFTDIERIDGASLIETLSDAYGRYGEDCTIVLCRSNKRAIRYNLGIRSMVQFKEERLVRGERLMIVKNCYQFLEGVKGLDYIANGDTALLGRISRYHSRYGFEFAEAQLTFPDYGDASVKAMLLLNTLESESPSLTYEQQNALYQGVNADYSHIRGKQKRWMAVREDPFYNALQLKYAEAVTCHKSQGGQWDCVFIDCPFWQDEQGIEDLKWLYTALTRAVKKVYLVNFPDRFFV